MRMLPVEEQSCANCMFRRHGECRYHAPSPDSCLTDATWPLVDMSDWCGAWGSMRMSDRRFVFAFPGAERL
jgi:hypothetical protein